MRHHILLVTGLTLALGLVTTPGAVAAPEDHPSRGDLGRVARHNGLERAELAELLETDETVRVGDNGSLFFVDGPAEGGLSGGSVGSLAVPAGIGPEEAFELHSKPGSPHTIFLDFDGAVVTGTSWNVDIPDLPAEQAAWDPAGDGPGFDDAEREDVLAIWSSVAEDFAPFEVDVTTEEPAADALVRTSSADDTYGAHVVVTPGTAALSAYCSGCSGIARYQVVGQVLGASGDGYGYGYEQPSWVQTQNLGTPGDIGEIADVISHEVGHQVGLLHDDVEWGPGSYYGGHAGWAPIMGSGFLQPISQWSKGDYTVARNREDDVAIIESVFGERRDEAPSGITGAPRVPAGPRYVSNRDDVDTYRLGACTGPVTVTATGATAANLDILLTLRDSTGAAVTSADPPSSTHASRPASGLDATVTADVPAGDYFVSVDGVGRGTWASSGYDDYGSLGAYTLDVTGDCVSDVTTIDGPTDLTATATSLTAMTVGWVAPYDDGLTGFRLTRTGSSDDVTVDADVSTYTWTGLDPDSEYTFTVTALTAAGASAPVLLTARTPSGPPDAVRLLRASAWSYVLQLATVQWDVPASTGGVPVIDYAVYVDGELVATTSSLSHQVRGLGAGTHVVGVAARTLVGEGPVATIDLVVLAPPANDEFETRQVLTGPDGSVLGDNTLATKRSDDPVPPVPFPPPGGYSVWYSWTAPASGPVVFTTTTSADQRRDTILSAYTGTGPGDLQLVASNDDVSSSFLSTIEFAAEEGRTYTLVVDGFASISASRGSFTLSWDGTAAPQATQTSLAVSVTGRSASLRATVVPDPSGDAPAGTVVFADGGTVLDSVPTSGTGAGLELTGLAAGPHTFTATFQPADADAFTGSSDERTVEVAATPTTTGLVAEGSGRTVSLAATVTASGEDPAGVVEFRDGSMLVGTAQVLGGVASLTLTGVSVGTHTYTATFTSPTGDQQGSTSPSRQVVVRQGSRTTLLVPASVKKKVVPIAAVLVTTDAGLPASGRVTVAHGTTTTTVTLVLGIALVPMTGLKPGTYVITATYQGNATTKGSAASATMTVTK